MTYMTPVEIAEKMNDFLIEKTDYQMYKVSEEGSGTLELASFAQLTVVNQVPENDEYPYFEVQSVDDIIAVCKNMGFKATEQDFIDKTERIISQSGVNTQIPMFITYKYV